MSKLGQTKLNGNSLIYIVILCSACLIFFSYYTSAEVTKYFLYISITIIIGYYLFNINIKGKINHEIWLYICLIFVIINYFIGGKYLPQLVFFISALFFMDILYKKGISKKSIRLLLIVFSILIFQALFETFISKSFNRSHQLTLCFKNPNMTSIVLSNISIIIMVGFFYFKNKLMKIMCLLLFIVGSILVYMTNNRGSIFTLIVFLLLILFYIKGKNINNYIRIILILSPVIIFIVYISLMQIIPPEYKLFGKPFFSGREIAWKYVLEQLMSSNFILDIKQTGLNSFLTGITFYGFFTVAIYYTYLFFMKVHIVNNSKWINFKQVAYIGFYCTFIAQCFESTVFTGSYGVFIISYLLLGISSNKEGI